FRSQSDFFEKRLDDVPARGRQVKNPDAVPWCQEYVGRRTGRFQCSDQIGGERGNPAFRTRFTPDQDVMMIGIWPEFIDRTDDTGQAEAFVPGSWTRPINLTFKFDARVDLRPQSGYSQDSTVHYPVPAACRPGQVDVDDRTSTR